MVTETWAVLENEVSLQGKKCLKKWPKGRHAPVLTYVHPGVVLLDVRRPFLPILLFGRKLDLRSLATRKIQFSLDVRRGIPSDWK